MAVPKEVLGLRRRRLWRTRSTSSTERSHHDEFHDRHRLGHCPPGGEGGLKL